MNSTISSQATLGRLRTSFGSDIATSSRQYRDSRKNRNQTSGTVAPHRELATRIRPHASYG